MKTEHIEELKQPITVQFTSASAEREPNPFRVTASHIMQMRIWQVVAVVALLIGTVTGLAGYQMGINRFAVPVVLLGEDQTFHVAPFRTWDEASEIHTTLGKQAATALLERDFRGFAHQEELERLFDNRNHDGTGSALEKAEELHKTELTSMVAKKLHQFPKFQRIEVVEQNANTTILRMEGQLLQQGSVGKEAFSDLRSFDLILTTVRNPNIAHNGRYPSVVVDFKIRISDGPNPSVPAQSPPE